MEEAGESSAAAVSLRPIRIVAAIGLIVALGAVVLGFSFGVIYGLIAILAVPAVPLLSVLAFEAVRGTPSG